MRIDAHAHWWTSVPADPTAAVAAYRQRGIDRVVAIESEARLFEPAARCADFAIPVAQVDIDTVTPDEISRLLERGARGIKFIGPLHSYGADCYFPLYARLCEHGAPAVFHTGYLVTGLFEPGGVYEKPALLDITDMRPAAVDRIVRGFPRLKILLAHFGNPWWEEAWKMIASHRNVYADLSGGTAYRRSLLMWSEMFAPNGVLDAASAGKLCFGTDAGYFDSRSDGVEAYLTFYEQLFDRIGLPAELREQVNAGNTLKLFGL